MRTQGGAGSHSHTRAESSRTPNKPGQADSWRLTFFEERTVRVCIAVTLLLVAGVVVLFFIEPTIAMPLAIFMVSNLIVGREISIAIGTALGLPAWLLVAVNVSQSVSMGLLIYLGAVHVLGKRPDSLLGRAAHKMRDRARRHDKIVDNLGPPGLFLLMLLPFFAHPFIGAMSGRLGGLDLRQMLIPIVASTFLVAAFWAYSMSAILDLLRDVWQGFDYVIVALVAVIVALVTVSMLRKRQRKTRGSGENTTTRSRA